MPNESRQHPLRLSDAERQAAGIVVQAVAVQSITDRLVLTANISANQDRMAHIGTPIEGRIVEVSAKLGDGVRAGQILAMIDSVQVGEARAEYRRTHSELRLAEAAYRRTEGLYREEVVPQKQWLEARAAYERAQASAQAAVEKLRLLGGSVDGGGSRFPITTPLAGTVIEKKAVAGELARSDANLFTVVDLSTVWIEADVAERDLGKLVLGAPAAVTVDAFPNDIFRGKLSFIASTVDRQTRTIKARVVIVNPDGKLRLDMFANAAIARSATRDVLLVPQDAVVMIQNQSAVYVPADDHFEVRPVELGERFNDKVAITAGLKPGEPAVVAGAYSLKARQLKSQLGNTD